MIPSVGETFVLALYKRLENSAYEYESKPSLRFHGRMANNLEKRSYNLLSGVNSTEDSIMIYSSRLPSQVKDGDKVLFMGKMWTVESVGYYFLYNTLINASALPVEQIEKNAPKGLVLR